MGGGDSIVTARFLHKSKRQNGRMTIPAFY